MIDLYYINKNVFVFDVEKWYELRSKHRIIGEIIGNTHFVPALPVKLLHEEVLFLLEQGIAELYLVEPGISEESDSFSNELLKNQKIEYKKIRRKQLELIIDKIVQKRRNSGDIKPTQDILEEELDKSCIINLDNFIWPIFLQHPFKKPNLKTADVEEYKRHTNKLKYLVYKDLLSKKYYVTHGHKFGGDFLVYNGDPVIYHAIFVVRCVERTEKMSPQEIVAFGRLGTSVRKRAVVASVLDNDAVSYVTINWIDA
ncbi:uncharacterized protein LOC109609293 [Aethina tumida]|uniref:uncharacterized protein LOC109609293 n=1 Tax=Aethina tumida TaxID=116153 RepID=UPI002148EA8A|nr:uncharacterized protein LOC109609293 [Aethina tumida]